jgi:hypothetical protein
MANYPLNFPNVPIATERFAMDRRQQALESPFTFGVKVIHTASRWMLEWSFPRVTIPKAEAIVAWGLSLNGQEGSFKYYPNQTITSGLTGRTLVTIGYGYNKAIKIGGYTASALSTIRVGQWFQVGTQLLRVTEAAAIADANGQVTISFEPALRAQFPVGTAVEFVRPFGVFRFAQATSPTYTLDADRKPDFGTIQAVEVVTS